MSKESIALNRFGLGARPDDTPPGDPQRWLLSQLEAYDALPPPWQKLPRTDVLQHEWAVQQRTLRAAPEAERQAMRDAFGRQARETYQAAVGARAASALQSGTPFMERMAHFWANHFAISAEKQQVLLMAGAFETDAIRPHVTGRFEDMLLAVVRHPAMLYYLDQTNSVGPASQVGQRSAKRRAKPQGLNENLAREILELHTLGVRSGYTQEDVTEFARALTGWTVAGEGAADGMEPGNPFRFRPGTHEPGKRVVLGRSYAEGGEEQARAILRDVAAAPATAQHIAMKLARHFVADDPPPALVARLADSFQKSGGELPSVYRTLVLSPEAWLDGGGKFKSPWDWSISSMRAFGRREMPGNQANNLMNQLGQPVWKPGSPAGYGDTAGAWAAPDALVRRVETAQRLAAQAGGNRDARQLAPQVLPGALGDMTKRAIANAESPATALALLLACPEFLRR
ncbi:DUF1800 domain-containing protein [Massilia sp. G4R7]|uniref:DUF1800 domain-containing protein n=1 Tax=Massilia phyllostachyos TaxID=2898585 RepID=A0ABS8Q8T5_9BURK|nr:DUF1800 domain-containing protein [Massilia phyllostachyos]MCD2518144.1 DUF1800 domain-containing protein [Massilia phyllostachyos]